MTRFENSEVMLEYAALTKDGGLLKEAWTWRDIVTELGIGAAMDLAIVGGLAAAGISSGPIGWVLLGGAAVTMAVWYFTRQMDDNLPDLIDRLEDLDPNSQYEAKVQGWITRLKQFQTKTQAPPTTTNQAERGKLNAAYYASMRNLQAYLGQMWQEWPIVKANLDDMVFDPGQAEHAIQETLAAVNQSVEQMKAAAKQDEQEMLARLKQKSKVDYTQLATDIVNLHKRLTQMAGGKPPQFERGEEHLAAALQIAQNILSPEAKNLTEQDIMALARPMQQLKAIYEQGIKQLQQDPLAKASSEKFLSKRAVLLGDGNRIVMPDTGAAGKGKQRPGRRKAPRGRGSPVVLGLQHSINAINYVLNAGAGTQYPTTGIYDKNTADALIGALSSNWKLQKLVSQQALVNMDKIQDIEWMRQHPRHIRALYRTLSPIAKQLRQQGVVPDHGVAGRGRMRPEVGQYERGLSVRDDRQQRGEYGTQVECRPDKFTPTPDEILACLKQELQIEEPRTGRRMYAYDWMRSLGIGDNTMVAWINGLFPPGEYRPMDWSPGILVEHVKSELSRSKKESPSRPKTTTPARRISIPTDERSKLYYLKNYYEVVDPATDERLGAYFWLQGKGLDRYVMMDMLDDFVEEQLGGERVWNTQTTPRKFTAFVNSRLGGRAGGARFF